MVKRLYLMAGTAICTAVAACATAVNAASPCERLAPPTPLAASRMITAEDLVQLRDIGPSANTDTRAAILSVSPDKRLVAFQIRQADIETNGYCLRMYVLALGGRTSPVQVDEGGDFFHATYSQLGFAAFTSPGPMPVITPVWSPDSRWIAYLRQDDGVTQVWRSRADGAGARPVTHLSYDAETFAWSDDGKSLIVSGRPALVAARDAIREEGASGYLYDDRFAPVSGSAPVPREPIDSEVEAVDVATGQVRSPTSAEIARLSPEPPAGKPDGAVGFYPGPGLAKAWTTPDDPHNLFSARTLHVRWANGTVAACPAEACGPTSNLWWSADGQTVYVFRAGWQTDTTELLTWRVGDSIPLSLYKTSDVLIGCEPAGAQLICGYETSLHPRTLVSIDLATGERRTLFDPNPEVTSLRLGTVVRLRWTNAFGVATWGDLVLPPDHKVGQKHPLVVVQYESRGFLRGGTGDDYPIQVLVAHGLAVLSFQRPPSLGMVRGVASYDELNHHDMTDWTDRRSIQSSLDLGIDAAISTGAIDGNRLGLTGLSDGATTAQFALVNHPRYRAVAISTCCNEPDTMSALVGDATRTWFAAMGYPPLSAGDDHFWAPMSWQYNSARIDAPVLMQLSDREYLDALSARTALIEQHKPVEMYVYPDEYHVKWQPLHRLAVYARAVDWFGFWLQGREDPDPRKARQYERWRKLKS